MINRRILFCSILSILTFTSSTILPFTPNDMLYYYKYEKFVKFSSNYKTGLEINKEIVNNQELKKFYEDFAGNKKIADEIINECIQKNVPINLAFALVKFESNFDIDAINYNKKNGEIVSIDRGLFQLNNKSFPQLSEVDFFNYKINIHYGVSHLAYCINSFGNNTDSLVAYNAGHSTAKKSTNSITSDYSQEILVIESQLDDNFNSKKEAMAYEKRSLKG